MHQVLQNLATGEISLISTPAPAVRPGTVLIRTVTSVISAGTERMLLEFGRASYLEKVRQQPSRVAQVFDKIRTDGLFATADAVRTKLNEPIALGYCNAGIVEAVGAGVVEFRPGDRVVSNGAHAELVLVPKNLCALIPDAVDDEAAAFAVPGSIALQGIRLAAPTLGECFAVVGAGLIGLLAVQLLRANGCRVLAIDPDPARRALAEKFGAESCRSTGDPLAAAERFSRGAGLDGVIITATTKSSEPVAQAAKMSRKRGRIVLVGSTGLTLDRADFYAKEISFQVSCSYGPGRYDPSYEENGADYPLGFVRWTEQRNFSAVLDLMAGGALDAKALISHRYDFTDATAAYDALAGASDAIGILLEYRSEVDRTRRVVLPAVSGRAAQPAAGVTAVIGAGNYASRILIPALAKTGARLHTIVSERGISAASLAKRFGFEAASSNVEDVFGDRTVDTVVIATRHDSHASLAAAALRAGKHVFVEKPLAISEEGLAQVEEAYREARASGARLMVGFNRRFSPFTMRLKEVLDRKGGPRSVVITVNAGMLPPDNWNHDPVVGGGRLIGEGCHFVDLLRFLTGAPAKRFEAVAMEVRSRDTFSLSFEFEGGSIGTLHYFANGSRKFPKERVEVFADGNVFVIDNFRSLSSAEASPAVRLRKLRQDKGQTACIAAFLAAIREGGADPIAADEIFEVSRCVIEANARLVSQ